MSYLAVEEYHVRFQQGDQTLEGKMWLRAGEDWEVEVGDATTRLRASSEGGTPMDAHTLFERVVEMLAEREIRPLTCGTCANFRCSPSDQSSGWMGYCSYRDGSEAPTYPGEVALLAPNCHAYVPSGTNQPAADINVLEHETQASDPESTKVMPAVQAEQLSGGLLGKLRGLLGLERDKPEMVRAGVVERPGGQPCPVCGTRMTNRASVANMDDRGEERVISVWRCPHCQGNYLDDWFEAWVGSRARDAERLYVVPPVEANAGAAIVVHCPRPDVKGCTCIANQHFDAWGNDLEKSGRRIQARESVVSL